MDAGLTYVTRQISMLSNLKELWVRCNDEQMSSIDDCEMILLFSSHFSSSSWLIDWMKCCCYDAWHVQCPLIHSSWMAMQSMSCQMKLDCWLICSRCRFTITLIPFTITSIHHCYQLGTNALTMLPSSIGNLTNLTKLNVRMIDIWYDEILTSFEFGENRLQKVPKEIGRLTNLTEIYVWLMMIWCILFDTSSDVEK